MKNTQVKLIGGKKGFFFFILQREFVHVILEDRNGAALRNSGSEPRSLPLNSLPLFRTWGCKEFPAAFVPAGNPVEQRGTSYSEGRALIGMAWVMYSPPGPITMAKNILGPMFGQAWVTSSLFWLRRKDCSQQPESHG